MNFNDFKLDARLQAGIQNLGFSKPTPIQEAAIPAALRGHDLIGTAQTGTGKTAAFVLPILHHLIDLPRKQTRALIITPTRELAEQIHEAIHQMAVGTGLRSATIYGGVGSAPQIKALREGVEILVACPGRLLDLVEQRYARLDHIEVLILDEADRMFDMGFLPSVKRIIRLVPAERQTMLFSATFPEEVEQLASQALRSPTRINLSLRRPVETVQHAIYPISQGLKTNLLLALLKQTDADSILIFTRTRHRARRLAQQISREGRKVASLHSDRTQSQRKAALDGFRSGRYQILVATDIAARGLDVEGISHVINFDMPNTADDYIHRIGRTGRAEHKGEAFTFVTPEDNPMVRTLENIMGEPLERHTLPDFDYQTVPVSYPPSGTRTSPPSARPGMFSSRRKMRIAPR